MCTGHLDQMWLIDIKCGALMWCMEPKCGALGPTMVHWMSSTVTECGAVAVVDHVDHVVH